MALQRLVCNGSFVFYQRTVALQFVLVSTVQQRVHGCTCVHMCAHMCECTCVCVSICVYIHPLPLGPPSRRHPSPLGRHRALGSAPSARQQLPTGCLSHARECVCVNPTLPVCPTLPFRCGDHMYRSKCGARGPSPKGNTVLEPGHLWDFPGLCHCRSPPLLEDEEGACDRPLTGADQKLQAGRLRLHFWGRSKLQLSQTLSLGLAAWALAPVMPLPAFSLLEGRWWQEKAPRTIPISAQEMGLGTGCTWVWMPPP